MNTTCIGIAALSTFGWIWQYLRSRKLKASLKFYEAVEKRVADAERTIAGLETEVVIPGVKKAA